MSSATNIAPVRLERGATFTKGRPRLPLSLAESKEGDEEPLQTQEPAGIDLAACETLIPFLRVLDPRVPGSIELIAEGSALPRLVELPQVSGLQGALVAQCLYFV